jgi:uncharacterized protein (TIGR02722 family)
MPPRNRRERVPPIRPSADARLKAKRTDGNVKASPVRRGHVACISLLLGIPFRIERNTNMHILKTCLASIALAGFLTGCYSVSQKDPERTKPITSKYDQNDLLQWGKGMAKMVLEQPFPGPNDKPNPIMVVMGIQNRTATHIDTKAISDTMRNELLNSGKMQFVNETRRDDLLKEQGYQLANATPESRVNVGKQLGAKFMITGSLTEIKSEPGREIVLRRTEDVFYQLTVEITDLETGLIVLSKQTDRLRRAYKPVIGW